MTFLKNAGVIAATVLLAAGSGRAQFTGAATMTIQADQPGVVISSNLFGIFFEEINYGGEGGVYGEMVRNRSFDDKSAYANGWTLATQGSATGQMSVDTSQAMDTNNIRALQLSFSSGSGSAGAANGGYWGMNLQAGSNYILSFYACAPGGYSGAVSARLESADGSQVYAQTNFSGVTTAWQRFSAQLTPSANDASGRLVVSIASAGSIWLDVVSLFPQATFHKRANGMRPDLANKLADLKPGFMRFPGGCFVEGNYLTNAFRWKKTIGNIAARPGHWNGVWNYWCTDGLGYHEFLQLSEDLGAEPMFGINCGMSHSETVPLANMGEYVQDALDAIEYANGSTNTTWGALRAANGHPAPFNLKYMEIGNENGGTSYNDRYALFYDAIKAVYPEMNIIACVWGGTPSSRPFDLMDEHYYSSSSTFVGYATKYDSYSRTGPKVFVGEYAVTSGYGTLGNLSAALGEACFMTGMERNADIVKLACYAPLFANVSGMQWHPNLVNFDSTRSLGTPAYYVQKMFSNNRGDAVLPSAITITSAATNLPPHGAIGLGSWNTSVQYTNIVVRSNGVTLYQSDFAGQGTNGWRVYKGTWSANAGLYQQTSASTTDCRSTTGNTNWASYTLSLRARKVSGSEGFLILFNWQDDNNWTWWNIGGWNNAQNGIEQCVNGSKSTLGQVSQTITTGQWYDISIVLTNSRMLCYLNGALSQDVSYPATAASGLIASTSYRKAGNEIIVKAVNPYSTPMATTVQCSGLTSIASNATVIQLTSGSPSDENSLAAPLNVSPVTSIISNASTNFTITLPANSLSILRLQAIGVNTVTNLQIGAASSLYTGQSSQAALWASYTGQPGLIDLATNSNRAITWSSANPAIAKVNDSGLITAIGYGTTTITASYPALGLSTTHSIQVIRVPVTLVHRYAFDETTGTNAADSVGGPFWDGTLPRGGQFSGGTLTLSSNSQHYLNLPGGILSNYTAVTIESWGTFPDQLPVNCFYFGFGNYSGSAGYNYIFCAPRAGRAAITSGSNGPEQNAYAGLDFSYRTNLHLTFVFNPPAGYIAIYTNGSLAGINNAVTTPFSSVTNVYSWIGRSLYSADPYPTLILDEFRIYNGALDPDQIAATQALGPNQPLSTASPTVSLSASSQGTVLSWPLASAGFALQSRTNLVLGAWEDVASPAPQIVGGQWQVTLPLSGEAAYYRLRQ